LGVKSLSAVATTYVLGIFISLMLNGRWTFSSLTKKTFLPATTRFVLLYLFGLGYSLLTFQVLAKIGLPNLVTQLMVMGSCAILLFIGQKYWVFSMHRQQEAK
jgi:putative flippase GtrA